MDLDPETGRWEVYIQTSDNDWHQLVYGFSSFTYYGESTVALAMIGGTRMHVAINGVRAGMFSPADSPDWPGGEVPDRVHGVGLGGIECLGNEGGVEFDWVEIFGTEG